MPYIGNQPGTGVRSRFIYTATASQTTFTGADNNSKTLKYSDADYIDVYLNGVCLVPVTDYAASTKTSVVLTQAASLNDTLEVVAYDIATISDTVSKADGGTFEANVTFAAAADIITETLGTDNVRIGENAGDSITSGGANNVTIGKNAGTAITTGKKATLIGAEAGEALVDGDNNTAVGYQALTTDTNGEKSVAVGTFALTAQNQSSLTDTHNTAVGYQAGTSVTTGVSNTLIGARNGDALTVGSYNVAVGDEALGSEIQGSNSVAVGVGALLNQNVGSATSVNNTAVGHAAGNQVTTGTANTLIGSLAGDALTVGELNTAIGVLALSADDGGSRNTVVGYAAFQSQNPSGSSVNNMYNTGLGYGVGSSITTGYYNTFVGGLCGDDTNDGIANTAMGYLALSANCGDGNTAVGRQAGTVITGSNNTCVGDGAGESITSGSDNIMIGHDAGSGQVTTSNDQLFIARSNASLGTDAVFLYGGNTGALINGDNSSTFNTVSDERIKKNIVDSTKGLAEILQVKIRNFEYRTFDELDDDVKALNDGKGLNVLNKSGVKTGVIAQELEEVFPNDVTDLPDGTKNVKIENTQWALIKAVQELSAKVDTLETENTAIKSRLDALEAE